jgi:hypothetical protein
MKAFTDFKKTIIFCLILFCFNLLVYAEGRKIPTEGKVLDVEDGNMHYFVEGDRILGLWPPRLLNKKLPWVKEAREKPLKFFHDDFKKYLNLFEGISKRFNTCIEGKKWPEKHDCIKNFDICFGGSENRCGFWASEEPYGLSELCSRDFKGCIKKNELDFERLSQCFNLTKHIAFRFYAFGPNGEREDIVQMRVTGGSYNDKKLYDNITCDFTIIDDKLSLVEFFYAPIDAKPYSVKHPSNFKPKYAPSGEIHQV